MTQIVHARAERIGFGSNLGPHDAICVSFGGTQIEFDFKTVLTWSRPDLSKFLTRGGCPRPLGHHPTCSPLPPVSRANSSSDAAGVAKVRDEAGWNTEGGSPKWIDSNGLQREDSPDILSGRVLTLKNRNAQSS